MLAALTAVLVALLVTLTPADAARAASPWQWPVEPARVVHAFDPPDNPWESGHRGVDLAASIGQAIHAPTEGSVTFAGVIAGRGVVVVSHGAVRTTYEPVQKTVAVGATVHAGDVLGTLQAFAHHCSSPCLHWGAIQGETYLDPTSFVVPKPSRLLPVWSDAPRLPAEGPATGAPDLQSPPDVIAYQHGPSPSDRSAHSTQSAEPSVPWGDVSHRADAVVSRSSSSLRPSPAPEAGIDTDIAAPAARRAQAAPDTAARSSWPLIGVLPCLAILLAVARPSRRRR